MTREPILSIAERVCAELRARGLMLTPVALTGRSKSSPVALARWLTWHLARRAGYSTTQMGRAWDMDHSSVVRGLAKLGRRRTIDASLNMIIERLEADMGVRDRAAIERN